MLKLAAAALVVAACAFGAVRLLGGSDDERPVARETTTQPDTTEREAATTTAEEVADPNWVGRANAMCREVTRELGALATPSTTDELVDYLREAVALAEPYDRRFRALRVPPEAEDEMAVLERANSRAIRLLRDMLRAAERGDTDALFDHAQDAMALAESVNPTVVELGLRDCALPVGGLPA